MGQGTEFLPTAGSRNPAFGFGAPGRVHGFFKVGGDIAFKAYLQAIVQAAACDHLPGDVQLDVGRSFFKVFPACPPMGL